MESAELHGGIDADTAVEVPSIVFSISRASRCGDEGTLCFSRCRRRAHPNFVHLHTQLFPLHSEYLKNVQEQELPSISNQIGI